MDSGDTETGERGEAASEEPKEDLKSASGFYEAYASYSNVLRTWWVAYGVGALALLLTTEALREAIMRSGRARSIGLMLLIGVLVQVLLALLNKVAMWSAYYAEEIPTYKNSRRNKVMDWVSRQFWIDCSADLITLVLYFAATYGIFREVIRPPLVSGITLGPF